MLYGCARKAPLTPQQKEQILNCVRKVHSSTEHCSNKHLVQTLRRVSVKPEARRLSCCCACSLLSCFAFLAAAGPSGPPIAFAKAAGKGASGKPSQGHPGVRKRERRKGWWTQRPRKPSQGTPEFGQGKGEKGGGPKGQGKAAAGKGVDGGSGKGKGTSVQA